MVGKKFKKLENNKSKMTTAINRMDILERLRAGEPVSMTDPEYYKIIEVVNKTIRLSQQLNTSGDTVLVRQYLSKIIGTAIDESTTVFPPILYQLRKLHQHWKKCFYQSRLFIP
jgi:hypothetical protein